MTSLLISLCAFAVSAASLALSLWSLKLSRDADLNATIMADADLRRAHAERQSDA
jgi:hypothetical protein